MVLEMLNCLASWWQLMEKHSYWSITIWQWQCLRVYTRTGTVWTESTTLAASDGAAGALASSVAIHGEAIVIGADQDDVNGWEYLQQW